MRMSSALTKKRVRAPQRYFDDPRWRANFGHRGQRPVVELLTSVNEGGAGWAGILMPHAAALAATAVSDHRKETLALANDWKHSKLPRSATRHRDRAKCFR
jgi:hypothetical protein